MTYKIVVFLLIFLRYERKGVDYILQLGGAETLKLVPNAQSVPKYIYCSLRKVIIFDCIHFESQLTTDREIIKSS